MVKKKKKTKNTVSVFGKQIPSWAFVLGLFVIVIVGFIGYNAYLDYQDKQKFTQLEKTVDTLIERLDANFKISKIENTSYCYEPGRKLEEAQNICVYEQNVIGRFAEPNSIEKFIEEQTDLVRVRENNTRTLYLVSGGGRNCNYKYENASQIVLSCMGNTDFQHYPLK